MIESRFIYHRPKNAINEMDASENKNRIVDGNIFLAFAFDVHMAVMLVFTYLLDFPCIAYIPLSGSKISP